MKCRNRVLGKKWYISMCIIYIYVMYLLFDGKVGQCEKRWRADVEAVVGIGCLTKEKMWKASPILVWYVFFTPPPPPPSSVCLKITFGEWLWTKGGEGGGGNQIGFGPVRWSILEWEPSRIHTPSQIVPICGLVWISLLNIVFHPDIYVSLSIYISGWNTTWIRTVLYGKLYLFVKCSANLKKI